MKLRCKVVSGHKVLAEAFNSSLKSLNDEEFVSFLKKSPKEPYWLFYLEGRKVISFFHCLFIDGVLTIFDDSGEFQKDFEEVFSGDSLTIEEEREGKFVIFKSTKLKKTFAILFDKNNPFEEYDIFG